MITTANDARDLLLAAGVPEDEIDAYSIQMAQLYNEIVMRKLAELLVQRIVERLFNDDEGVMKIIRERLKG